MIGRADKGIVEKYQWESYEKCAAGRYKKQRRTDTSYKLVFCGRLLRKEGDYDGIHADILLSGGAGR